MQEPSRRPRLSAAALALLALGLGAPAFAGEKPPRPPRVLSRAERRRARLRELVEAWLKRTAPATPGEKKRIAELIAEFGSADFKLREAASEKILDFGVKARPQLGAALKSRDAEVARRAEKAIARIGTGEGDKAFKALCAAGNQVRAFIREEVTRLRDLADKANAAAAELEKTGRKAEAGPRRAEAAALTRKIHRLKKLYPRIRQTRGAMGAIPDIRTKVVDVRPATGHVALGAGKKSGVKEGFVFLIHRGDVYVGKVRVTTVWDSFAGGTIVERKQPLKAGDDAMTDTAPGP